MPSTDQSLLAKSSALHEYAAQLDRNADGIMDLAYDTARLTAAVRDEAYWTGQAAEGYSTFCEGLVNGLKNAPGPLHAVAQAVRQYAEQVGVAAILGSNIPADASAATDAVNAQVEFLKALWDSTESLRKVLETIMVPADLAGTDALLYMLLKKIHTPAEILEKVDELFETAEIARTTAEAKATLLAVAEKVEEEGPAMARWVAGEADWLQSTVKWASQLEWVSRTLGALGIVGDVGTLISPLDHGVMAGVDRAMALLNGGLLGVDLAGGLAAANSFDWVPVAGEVIIVGTGVFLAGDFLYHHWTGFRNVCDDVGHFTVNVAADAAPLEAKVVSTVESWF